MSATPFRTIASEKRDLIKLSFERIVPRVWRMAFEGAKVSMGKEFAALKIGHRLHPSFEMVLYPTRLEVKYLSDDFIVDWEIPKGTTKLTNFLLTTNWGDDDRVFSYCLEALMDHVLKMSQRVTM